MRLILDSWLIIGWSRNSDVSSVVQAISRKNPLTSVLWYYGDWRQRIEFAEKLEVIDSTDRSLIRRERLV